MPIILQPLTQGLQTAFQDSAVSSNIAYRPQFVSNNYKEGRKVLTSIESELLACQSFDISVAFITRGGIVPLLPTLKELEKRNIPGRILTTDYLSFNNPKVLKELKKFSNLTIKIYNSEGLENNVYGFHTKGYIFKYEDVYRIIVGSSNMTMGALTQNYEWNTKLVSTEQGEYTQDIVNEFEQLWNSDRTYDLDDFIEEYTKQYKAVQKERREISKTKRTLEIKHQLRPNSMQIGFIQNLKNILANGQNRALLISATGTGKTYASAFAIRELGYKRILFLVHRIQLAKQAKTSFENVFDKTISMGIVGGGYYEYDKDFIFAMVETLNKNEHLTKYRPDEFDCIVLDEAHHSAANTYQKVMGYFKPKLFLGMTATPDKRDDKDGSLNVYEIFHYQIAYEIRLQQAMEEDLLCPFHYFGISDIAMIGDEQVRDKNISERDFNRLVSDERVRHILEQANYYGYSGDRVKGLIFCSRKKECEELSKKFNSLGYRTVALSGDDDENKRQNAFERLAMREEDAVDGISPLDYIFSVDILNEGVDIVEINQVIMLRPTQSPIVFIQQLGRGLRKAEGKEYVVILDFIGNYTNNFMIPVALSGDRTYNADTIRKYVISGNNTIPGASTVYFDEIAKERIFSSIDRIRGLRSIIKESYTSLKNRLGRIPYLIDFYENGEIDPLVLIKEYKTYFTFLETVEKENYINNFTDQEKLTLEYLSKTILSGVRPDELEILQELLDNKEIYISVLQQKYLEEYGDKLELQQVQEAVNILQGSFVSKDEEYKKFSQIEILQYNPERMISRMESYTDRLKKQEFYKQIQDIVLVGLKRYKDKYGNKTQDGSPFVLYEKYSRRDVSLLMNCGRDLSSTMYGKSRIGDDVFIFITYHKEEAEDEKNYVDGKPDYADAFEDNTIFKWDSQIGRGPDSSYMQEVITAQRKHLLVKKSDSETSFYYMGQFDIIDIKASQKENNRGKLQPIAKVTMKMHHAVREDLLKYLQSKIEKETVS